MQTRHFLTLMDLTPDELRGLIGDLDPRSVFLYAPIALLPLFAFNDGQVIAFPLQGFSTQWFAELRTTTALHDAVRNSLFIAFTTAIFSTLLGVCAARAGAMAHFPGKGGIMGFIMLPLVLPEIIVAVSLLVVFLLPLHALPTRIKQAKAQRLEELRTELANVPQADVPRLEATAAHLDRIEGLSNWPVDLRVVSRILVYVVIPPLAWVAAALVENFIDQL